MSGLAVLIGGRDIGFVTQITSRLQEAGFQMRKYMLQDIQSLDKLDKLPDLLLVDIDDHDIKAAVRFVIPEWEEGPLPFPIVAFTESPSTEGLIKAFSAGANEYVSKTAPAEEWVARISNLAGLFRRIELHEYQLIEYKDLRIEIMQHKVFRSGEEISLTPKEFELLLFLAQNKERVCSREKLLQEVWGYDFTGKTNVVDVYIKHIRTKIDKGRRLKLLHTVRGAGYMLQ